MAHDKHQQQPTRKHDTQQQQHTNSKPVVHDKQQQQQQRQQRQPTRKPAEHGKQQLLYSMTAVRGKQQLQQHDMLGLSTKSRPH